MSSDGDGSLREQLVRAMRGNEAHLDFAAATSDFPAGSAGVKPAGAPHTAWQLVEHLRIALEDILEFSYNPEHKSPHWPDEYWPKREAPANEQAWTASLEAFQSALKGMEKLILDPARDLFKPIPGGDGQTLLREALLVAQHNSYHLGQIVFLKKSLGF